MKILQVVSYYYPHLGGIEQVARDYAYAFCRAGVGNDEQRIFCFRHDKGGDNTEEIDGVRVTRSKSFAKVASQSLSFTYGRNLKREINDFKPDLVVFHYPNPFAAHYLLKQLKKHPEIRLLLVWHLDIFKQKILKLFFSGQTKRLLRRAVKVVATSPNYIDGSKFLSAFRDKCIVIPNCVDTLRLEPTAADKAAAEKLKEKYRGKILCFALGRHVPYKGLTHLVGASKYLGENFAICIGGSGPLTESLKKQAAGDDKVLFTGRLSDGGLKAYLLAADIFCFPSVTKNEAFGIALAEAMYYSLPAVTFTVEGSGVNYVSINGVTGIETENANDEAFAAAIKTLGENPALRETYGHNAHERAVSLFSKDVLCDNVKNALESVFADNGNPGSEEKRQ